MMDRVNQIINHPLYKKELEQILALEQERIYCKHNIEHFLDVARVMYIFCLEEKQQIAKDIIYGTALLHDIGRAKEYLENIPHEMASVEISQLILPNCGYKTEEIRLITKAIAGHRKAELTKNSPKESTADTLQHLLKTADKRTRNCFACEAKASCNWDETKKNKRICY
jgi:Predicted HD superfamily hydrolase